MDYFVDCARNYRLCGAPLQDICEHNAELAERYDNNQVLTKTWLIEVAGAQSCIRFTARYFLLGTQEYSRIIIIREYLRNESNFFSVDRGINQKRTENCINARSALLQKFSVLFSVDTSINRKNI